jgi:putative chitinase
MNQIKNFQKTNNLVADGILGPMTLGKMKEVFCVKTIEHMGHLMGQCGHESANFTKSKEGLNYSVEGLMKTFGLHRISAEDCKKYGRTSSQPANQVAIGNTVYGGAWGRKNLGNTQPGDGYKYRGHGPLHMTGRRNVTAFAKFVNDPCVIEDPDLIISKYYFISAVFFFDSNKLWQYCNTVTPASILTVSRAVNIGNPNSTAMPNHLHDRIDKTNFYYGLLKRVK